MDPRLRTETFISPSSQIDDTLHEDIMSIILRQAVGASRHIAPGFKNLLLGTLLLPFQGLPSEFEDSEKIRQWVQEKLTFFANCPSSGLPRPPRASGIAISRVVGAVMRHCRKVHAASTLGPP